MKSKHGVRSQTVDLAALTLLDFEDGGIDLDELFLYIHEHYLDITW